VIRPHLLAAAVLVSCTSNGTSGDAPAPTLAAASAAGGFVSATVSSFAGPTSPALTSVAAAFWDEDHQGQGVRCSQRIAGACMVRACAPGGTSTRAPSSGDVRLDFGGAPLTLSADGNGAYPNPAGKVAPWAPSTPLRFVSSGAEVPAFDVTLTAPTPLRVLEPDPHGTVVAIDRAAGWSARWERGEGAVRVAVRQENAAGATALQGGVAIDCFYDRSAGVASVPEAALSDLSSNDANVMVFATRQTRVHAGRYEVMVLVNAGGVFQRATVH
jgi:hypothetical protein